MRPLSGDVTSGLYAAKCLIDLSRRKSRAVRSSKRAPDFHDKKKNNKKTSPLQKTGGLVTAAGTTRS